VADVSVRPARPEDAEHVARVQLATWQECYAALLPPEALQLPLVEVAAMWLRAIELPPSPQHRVLVALDGGSPVGFASLEGDELGVLLVEPRWGRRGHGSRLVAAAAEHWRSDGIEVATTWVFDDDTVVADFLTSAGWGPDDLGRTLESESRTVGQRRWHTAL
jgi:GNAT superfamily N-acetyltransferase